MVKRSKSLRIVLIGLPGLILAVAIVFGVSMWLEMRGMTPIETGLIEDSVFAVKDGYVNMFLIKGHEDYIAIDAGGNHDNIAEELANLKRDPHDVRAVFFTHSDIDHVGGAELFVNAEYFFSSAEQQIVNGNVKRSPFMKNRLGFSYNTIVHNQVIIIDGIEIRCLLVPGHTVGSMCYLVNGKFLFCGDCMSLKEGKVGLFNKFFNMDSEVQKESLIKLADLEGVEVIFTAHYGMTRSFTDAFNEIKEDNLY